MSDPHNRNLRPIPQAEEPIRRGRNIVAVIGIDNYQQLQILHNAVSDAKGIRALFVKQLGFQEITQPLYNEQATRGAITSMVIDQLGSQLEPDDNLVFFFAGHGYTDTRTVGTTTKETGYLIPVGGAAPDQRKFSTYLRLDAFLEDIASLPAMHILVILDACHSGFALGESVQVLRGGTQRYSDDLSKRMSRRVIASAMSDQPALDNGPVSGHSLFTGTLVEALAHGKADNDNKGFVTSSEMALYVQKQVATWSNSQQTPDFGSFELDNRGELVISLVGETQSRLLAQESLEIAAHVFELGWLTGDPKRFAFAAQQYREALRHALLSKIELPAAELGLGKALLAAGQTDEAIKILSELVARLGVARISEDRPGDAHFYLGIAHAQHCDYDTAAVRLHSWTTANPEHEDAAWVNEYIEWLKSAANNPMGRKRALLIGINEYQSLNAVSLRGCVNDVEQLIQPLLLQRFNFAQDDIQILTDSAATRQGILEAFATLKEQSVPGDTILIYYSGHSVPPSAPTMGRDEHRDVFWILHDTSEIDGKLDNGIAALELHDLLMEIPATHKTIILDTHSNWALIKQAEKEGGYHLLVASDSGEMAYESLTQIDGKEYLCGMLSMALYKSLIDLPTTQTVTYNEWVNLATQITQETSTAAGYDRQTPLFIGERDETIFGRFDPYLFAFDFSQRSHWTEISLSQLIGRYYRIQTFIQALLPRFIETYGLALYAKGAYLLAIAALQEGLEQNQDAHPVILRALAFAQIMTGDFKAALKLLKQHVRQSPTLEQDDTALILDHLQAVANISRHILIFLGIPNSEASANGASVKQQLTAIQEALQEKFGAKGYDLEIVTLTNAQEQHILERMQKLAAEPNDPPALVCIFGGGDNSPGAKIASTRVFKRCVEIIKGKSIFLWLQANTRSQINNQKVEEFYPRYLAALAQCLKQVEPRHSTNATFEKNLRHLVRQIADQQNTLPELLIAHQGNDQPFLSNQPMANFLRSIRQIEQKPLAEIANSLQTTIDKRQARNDLWPDGRLQLGIAYAELGEYALARRIFDEVIRICESGGRFMDEQAHCRLMSATEIE